MSMTDDRRYSPEVMQDVLRCHGFQPCDIPACNCGRWHQTGGYRARFDEIDEATRDYWRNGEMLIERITRIVELADKYHD